MNPEDFLRDPREASKEEWKSQYNKWPVGYPTVLYRCVWVERGKTIKDNAGSHKRASLGMEAKLSLGFAAWIEELPPLDDDVPF